MVAERKNYISPNANVAKNSILEAPVRLYGSAKLGKFVEIGKFSYVHTNSSVHAGSKVGRFCSIGKGTEIGPFDHPMERLSTSPVSYNMHLHFPDYVGVVKREKLVRKGGAEVGNDVWIGSNAVVVRGVRVGNGAVIGASAVVTKDVAPYSIVVGAPAKHIRFRFSEDICEELNELAWWDLPEEALVSIPFADVHESIDAIKRLYEEAINGPKSVEEIKQLVDEPPAGATLDHAASIADLREKIARIEEDDGGPSNWGDPAFLVSLHEKLFSLSAPKALMDFVQDISGKIFSNYDSVDAHDQQILNNKVMAIYELSISEKSDPIVLPPQIKKQILNIMASKH
jgi:acetyltransferase-like isoleucine patch superfamily enzyme